MPKLLAKLSANQPSTFSKYGQQDPPKPNWTNNARNEPATVAQAWNPLSGGGGGPCGARVDGAIIDSRPLAGLPPGTCFSMRSPILGSASADCSMKMACSSLMVIDWDLFP